MDGEIMGFANDEGDKLKYLVGFAESNVVEIGSLHGKSTSYLAQGKQPVYAIDLWDMVSSGDDRKDLYTDPKGYEMFLSTISGYDNVIPVKGSSKEIAKVWNRPIGLLFIDGDHSYEGAKCDYENFSPFVISGGFLAMHDYHEPEVIRVIEEIVKPSGLWTDYEVVRYLFTARRL